MLKYRVKWNIISVVSFAASKDTISGDIIYLSANTILPCPLTKWGICIGKWIQLAKSLWFQQRVFLSLHAQKYWARGQVQIN